MGCPLFVGSGQVGSKVITLASHAAQACVLLGCAIAAAVGGEHCAVLPR